MGIAVATAPREERVPVRNGLQIFIRSWIPAAKPRAIVGIVHGVKSHSGYYHWTAKQLVAQGFAVYALDLHGRGQSDGERFYLEQMSDYVDDVHALVTLAKSRHPSVPFFLLGHSAGGVVSCRLHARTPGGARGLHLRELRVPGVRAGPRAHRRQGAEPRRAARCTC